MTVSRNPLNSRMRLDRRPIGRIQRACRDWTRWSPGQRGGLGEVIGKTDHLPFALSATTGSLHLLAGYRSYPSWSRYR